MSAAKRSRRARRAAAIGAAARRLRRHYAAASPLARAIGAAWYADALADCRAIADDYGAPIGAVVGAAAALSPQVRWRENRRAARAVVAHVYAGAPLAYSDGRAGYDLPGYRSNHAKALACARGEPVAEGADWRGERDALGAAAPKVRAFRAAILGDADAVALDVWAMRAAYGASAATRPPSGDAYRRGALAYRAAARALGLAPRDLQAIVWTHVRGVAEAARDAADIARLFDADALAASPPRRDPATLAPLDRGDADALGLGAPFAGLGLAADPRR